MGSRASFTSIVRGVSTVSDGLSQETLLIRADRLDRMLDRQIMPGIALHVAMIGACFVIGTGTLPNLPWLFLSVTIFLALACGLFGLASAHRDGMFGSIATFATAAVVTSRIGPPFDLLLVPAIYVALVLTSFATGRKGRGLGTFPIYAAILIEITRQDPGHAVLLYVPIFVLGLVFALRTAAMASSLGLFIGLIIVLGPIIDDEERGTGSLIALSAMTIVALIIYLVRAGGAASSDLRNFGMYGLAALVVLVLISLLAGNGESGALWLWPMGLAALVCVTTLIRGTKGLAAAIAWVAVSLLAPIWLSTGSSQSLTAFSLRFGSMLLLAKLLDVVARRLRSPFVANIALLPMLAGVAVAAFHANPSWNWVEPGAPTPGMSEGFAFMMLAIAAILTCYAPVMIENRVAWWRGFLRPRHALFLRMGYRSSVQWFGDVPWLGSIFRLVSKSIGTLRYLKTGGASLRMADIVLLLAVLILAYGGAELLRPALAAIRVTPGGDVQPQTLEWLAGPIVSALCAALLYACGLLLGQTLFFFAGLIFALAPLISYFALGKHPVEFDQVGAIAIIVGIVILFCSLVRTIATAAVVAARRRGQAPAPTTPPRRNVTASADSRG